TLRTPRVGSPIQQAGPEAQDAASGSQDSKRQRQPDITQADDADARLTIVQARAVIMDHLGRQAPQRRNRLTAPQSSEFAGEEAFDDVASVNGADVGLTADPAAGAILDPLAVRLDLRSEPQLLEARLAQVADHGAVVQADRHVAIRQQTHVVVEGDALWAATALVPHQAVVKAAGEVGVDQPLLEVPEIALLRDHPAQEGVQ